jgi:periplasmic copper chaperone A
MKKILFFFYTLMLVVLWHGAMAHSYKQGNISIGHIWARATAPGMTTAAVYVPLLNTGKEPDQLIGASSDLADKIEIHQDSNENDIAKMQKLNEITLEPGKPVSLRPGGMHFMVIGLKKQLKEGEMFPMTLQFEKAGTAKVDAMIEAAGAMSGNSH